MEEKCRKLRATVAMMERDRVKFAKVDDRELDERRGVADELERTVHAWNVSFHSEDTRAKIAADQKRALLLRSGDGGAGAGTGLGGASASSGGAGAGGGNAYTAANSDFLKQQQQQQEMIKRQQDVSLDKMSSGLDRLAEMGTVIGDEVRAQGVMIEDNIREMDTVQNKMDSTIKHVEKLLGTKDRCQMCTMCALVVCFVITAIIAMYVLTS